MPLRTTLAVVLCVSLFASTADAQTYVYWSEQGTDTIRRSDPNGGNPQTLVSGAGDIRGLSIDAAAGQMYWLNLTLNVIQRANLDGSNVVTAVPNLVTPDFTQKLTVAVNPGQHIYWTDGSEGDIFRANFDGSNPVAIVNEDPLMHIHDDMFLDTVAGKLYSADLGGDVRRCNLDGTSPTTLHDYGNFMGSGPSGIAVDLAAGKIYAALTNSNRIDRMNLDGTGFQPGLVSLPAGERPFDCEVSQLLGKIYWADMDNGRIRRANLDGTGIETVVSDIDGARALELVTVIPEPLGAIWGVIFLAALTFRKFAGMCEP